MEPSEVQVLGAFKNKIMLIDETYFLKSETKLDTSSDSFIELIEPDYDKAYRKYLTYLFGAEEFFNFKKMVEENSLTVFVPEFFEGKPDELIEYEGFKFEYTGILDMLACFTFYEYVTNRLISNTVKGSFIPKNNIGEYVIPREQLCIAFNRGVDLYAEAAAYLLQSGLFPNIQITELKHINPLGI